MTHTEALEFLSPLAIAAGESWADLGAGTGVFSRALADFVGKTGKVYALDKNAASLRQLRDQNGQIEVLQGDFTRPLHLQNLDGILLANSLHYVRRQATLLTGLQTNLKQNGQIAIIEYESRTPNPWVPYPISFSKLEHLAERLNISPPEKLATRASRYHGEMYLAVLFQRIR
ncbi:MAG: class I SAM-dependent methyltransferase [Trueperaceae bacterium]|nr:class I SAM-dependent methyltransferase [Trueperaceae bacterium]